MIDRTREAYGVLDTEMGGGSDRPTVYPAEVGTPARSSLRLTLVALVLTLLLGTAAGGWAAMRWLAPSIREPSAVTARASVPPQQSAAQRNAPGQLPSVVAPVIATVSEGEAPILSARIAMLEDRLARISMAADSASGNAAKAEAILVAFAARRALDRGVGLGSMEAQLRLRFAETQPNAVESILFAAANPVTQEELVQRLDGLRALAVADGNTGWLTQMGSNLSSLISIRRSDAPSADPTQRFDRAMRAAVSSRVDQAIVEVEAMPGRNNQAVRYWLRDARRYYDARRALDLIETAALVEPGVNRGPAAP